MTNINTDGSKLLSDALPRPKPNQKHSQSFVEAAFKERGWELLSQYEGAHKKLNFICGEGHHHSMRWSSFQQGVGCAYCDGQVLTHDEVEESFRQRCWKLLSQYRNNGQKLDFICDKGHKHEITWRDFQRGHGCGYCAGRYVNHEQVEKAFKDRGWTLLSQYKNSRQKLDFICDKGHKHSIKWEHFQAGVGCAYCSRKAITDSCVIAAFESKGWKLLSAYQNAKVKLDCVCSKGHRVQISWGNFQSGKGCVECAPTCYSKTIPGRLYYIRFDFPDRPPLYKIGITNRSVKARFAPETAPYTILLDEWHKDGSIPAKKEKSILKRYKKYQYKGPKLLESGDTECFNKDVLGLDKPLAQLPLPLDIA